MKDWKAECDKLRGELQDVRRQLDREQQQRRDREIRSEEIRDKFKELLIDVLGR